MNIHELIKQATQNNQFASGGLLLMAVGGMLAYLRSIPLWLWYKIEDQCTISVTVTDDTNAYKWLRHWFNQRPNTKKIRRVDIQVRSDENPQILPAPGGHWTWYRGRPVHFTFTRKEDAKGNYQQKRLEEVTLRTIGRSQEFVRDFLKEIEEAYEKSYNAKPSLFIWDDGIWQEQEGYEPRKLESVLLPTAQKQLILGDIQTFKDSRSWYDDMGIPYHRGYLFYGLPGTGKTSLVTGLSSHFNSKVYILKLSDFNDRSLSSAVSQVEAHSMIIMEDADCIKAVNDREQKEKKQASWDDIGAVTLSGLLNVIDGMLTPNGVMFFMTTNHVSKLDPALIRPGRIDLKLEFGLATLQQKADLYDKFFPGEAFPLELRDIEVTMADLQGRLMLMRNERLLKGEKLEVVQTQRRVVAREDKDTVRRPQYARRNSYLPASTPLTEGESI